MVINVNKVDVLYMSRPLINLLFLFPAAHQTFPVFHLSNLLVLFEKNLAQRMMLFECVQGEIVFREMLDGCIAQDANTL